jgi:hypothetical protein
VRRSALLLAIVALCLPAAASAETITIAPNAPGATDNKPFGATSGLCTWTPYFAGVYKNVPPFALKPGDGLSFDLKTANDVDIHLDVELAATAGNGSDVPAGPFTRVVPTAQTPSNPRGNTTQGDFELGFSADTPFSFPGGGLIIRMSNPSSAFATDASCAGEGWSLTGDASDASAYFVKRAWGNSGQPPWQAETATAVPAFRLQLAPVTAAPPPADTRAPLVKLGGARKQHVLRQHGAIVVRVRPDEPARISATATIALPKGIAKVLRVKTKATTVAAGKRKTLKLRASKRQRKSLRRAFRRRKSLKAKVVVTARDAAGNRRPVKRTIKLVP